MMFRLVLVSLALSACGSAELANSCTVDADCTAALPFCVDRVCHACGGPGTCTPAAPRCEVDTDTCGACSVDDDCAAYPGTTRCATDGTCVGCADTAQCANPTPVCDAGTHTCGACTADADCASLACDLATGACIDAARVIYASPAGGATAACSPIDPCSLGHALTLVTATRDTIKLAAGSYATAPTITGAVTARIHGTGASLVTIAVQDGAAITLQGLTTSSASCSASKPGLAMPTLALDTVTATNIVGQPCMLSIVRSQIGSVTADGEAIGFNGATADRGTQLTIDRTRIVPTGLATPAVCILSSSTIAMTNSVIANLDANQPALGCWNVANGAHLLPAGGTIAFTTFFAAPIACQDATANAPTVFHFTNNIIASPGATKDVVAGTYCDHRGDIATPQLADLPGTGNHKNIDPMLRDPAHGDFHPAAGSPAIDAADPASTTNHDFDGVSRPQRAANDIGAFEVRPQPMPHL